MINVKGDNPKNPALFIAVMVAVAYYSLGRIYGWRFWTWPWREWLRF